jgi:chaperonin GroES
VKKASAQLASALTVWPLDREQMSLVEKATAGIDEEQARALLDLLREAESAVVSCGSSLMVDKQTKQRLPHSGKQQRYGAKFAPLHDRVVVKRFEAKERTESGLTIPDTVKEKPQEGKVVAVGPGARDESGKLVPLDVKAGDRVLFGKWSGTEVEIDGDELLIMKESDIIGVIQEPRRGKRRTSKSGTVARR